MAYIGGASLGKQMKCDADIMTGLG